MASTENGKSLESWIWEAACSIRGAKDAPKFKDYILPLIFTKRLCDVFDDELNRIAKVYVCIVQTASGMCAQRGGACAGASSRGQGPGS